MRHIEKRRSNIILAFCFIFFITAIIVISFVNLASLNNSEKIFEQTYNDSFLRLSQVEQARANLTAVHRAMKDIVLSSNLQQFSSSLKEINKYDEAIKENFATIKNISSSKDNINDIINAYSDWEILREKTIEQIKSGSYPQTTDNIIATDIEHVDLIADKIQLLIDQENLQVQGSYQTLKTVFSRSLINLFSLIIVTIILLVLLSVFTWKKVISYEKKIYNEREELKTIFNSIGDGVITTDLKGNIIEFNNLAQKLTGWKSDEASGMRSSQIVDVINEKTGEKAIDPVEQVLETNENYKLENHTILISKNGEKRYITRNAAPIRNKDGKTVGVVMTFNDVTAQKLAQIALANSEKRLERAQNIANFGSWELDIENKQIWATQGAKKIYGIDDEDIYLPLDMVQNVVCKEDRPKMDRALELLITKGKKYDVEFSINRVNDGKKRTIHSSADIEFDTDGKPIKVLGALRDITEQKLASEYLKMSNEKYKSLYMIFQQKQALLTSLINAIPDLFFYKDREGVYLGCNRAFEIFAGKEEKELVGHTDFDIFDKDTAQLFREMDIEMMVKGEPKKNEELVVYPNGQQVLLETLKTPLFDKNGNILGLIGISRDITERKRKEDEILYLSYNDVLTGLYNRRFFEAELSRIDTERNIPITIVMADVNGLKLINDSFGHASGDELLKSVAVALKKGCRSDDIVARLGGDEFVILLPKTGADETEIIIKRIKENLLKEKIYSADISVSFGFESKMDTNEKIEAVLKKAEDNMYKQKMFESPSTRGKTINAIMRTLCEKNKREELHSYRVSDLCIKMGEAIGLPEHDIKELKTVGLLHDIGKIAVRNEILDGYTDLTELEWEEIRRHPEVGYRILCTVGEMTEIANYVLCHHERWNGKGYPQKLKGEEIPLQSRIIALADSYDAMVVGRPYKNALSHEEAVEEIRNNAGKQFDPSLTEIFIEMISIKENRQCDIYGYI